MGIKSVANLLKIGIHAPGPDFPHKAKNEPNPFQQLFFLSTFFSIQILPQDDTFIINLYIQRMSSTSFRKQSHALSPSITECSSLNAPLHHPIDQFELPPELLLDRQPVAEGVVGGVAMTANLRRKSMDQPFSIIGFMERRIGDKRSRLYSETLLHPQSQKDYI